MGDNSPYSEPQGPLTPKQLALVGAHQKALAQTTAQVYDPVQHTLVDVPKSDLKMYEDAGFTSGADADLQQRMDGPEGQAAAFFSGAASGATMGASDYLLPRNLQNVKQQVDALHKITAVVGQVMGGLPALAASGGAGAALAAGKYARLGAAVGRVTQGAIEGGIRAATDADKLGEPLTAERFIQGVGIGGLIGTFAEGGAAAIEAAAPAFQRSVGRTLTRLSKSGKFVRLAEQLPEATDTLASHQAEQMGDAAREALGIEKGGQYGPREALGGWERAPAAETPTFRSPRGTPSSASPPPLPPKWASAELMPDEGEAALFPSQEERIAGRQGARAENMRRAEEVAALEARRTGRWAQEPTGVPRAPELPPGAPPMPPRALSLDGTPVPESEKIGEFMRRYGTPSGAPMPPEGMLRPLNPAAAEDGTAEEWAAHDRDVREMADRAGGYGNSEAVNEMRDLRGPKPDAAPLEEVDHILGETSPDIEALKVRAQASRKALGTPDAALDAAFERTGLNAPAKGDTPVPLPEMFGKPHAPEMTEIPSARPARPLAAGEPLTPEAIPENPTGKFPKSSAKDMKALRGEVYPEPKYTLPKLDRSRGQQVAEEFANPYGRAPAQYRLAGEKGKAGFRSMFRNLQNKSATAYFLSKLHPALGVTYGMAEATMASAKHAALFALNHEYQINRIVDFVAKYPMKMTSQVARQALEVETPNLSSAYLAGNVDEEYRAIHDGVTRLAAQPEALEQYYNGRYGNLLTQHREFYGNIVQQAHKHIQYLNGVAPKSPVATPGLLDPDYDPPRSVKVKFLQAYKGCNDPYSTFMDPTYESMAAANATHPETVTFLRRTIMAQLMEPGAAAKLSREQTRKLTILLGAPIHHADSADFVAGLQATAAANGAPPPTPAPTGGASNTPKINGQQGQQFASMVAPPSQQNALENLGAR